MHNKPNADIPYLSLDPRIEEQIQQDMSSGVMSPYAFKDENVIRREDPPSPAPPSFAT